jgi:hypothetical protein
MTLVLAVFAVGQLCRLTQGPGGASAAAQEAWNDESQDEARVSVPAAKTLPASIAGKWAGNIDDAYFKSGTINMNISQNGTKLSGQWNATFGNGLFKGSINQKDALQLTLNDGGGCHLTAVGMLVSANEITGTYKVKGCGKRTKGDHGTIDITRN